MMRLPVKTRAHAPQAMAFVWARTIGRPKAEMTRMTVTKIEVSAQALLDESILYESAYRRDMT